MKFLLDTNILIPLEPSFINDLAANSPNTTRLIQLLQENNHQIFVHPKSYIDISRDKDESRKELRKHAFNKYPQLHDLGPLPESFSEVVGYPKENSNDDIDNNLLYALYNNATDFFVSEDRGIHKKARRLNLANRVLLLSDALYMLKSLHYTPEIKIPVVELKKTYSLSINDPIFDSLKNDYDGFDIWFTKSQKEHRECFIIATSGKLDAIAILKEENSEYSMTGKILKVCTLKVADHASGLRYGELLLKAIFNYAYEGLFDWIYVTAFTKNKRICVFLDYFGFSDSDGHQTSLGEHVFIKKITPTIEDSRLDHLSYHINFGPKFYHPNGLGYIVPIKPKYHDMLFPELEYQSTIFAGQSSFGNSILKAYLCHSNILSIDPGSQLFFYQSGKLKSIHACGIVEESLRSINPEEITSFVGKRTVYPLEIISKMCQKSSVFAILFRQSNSLKTAIDRKSLELNSVFIRPPQSIMKLQSRGLKWLRKQTTV